MKLSNVKNVERFFKFVDSCNGPVYITGSDGTRINLKSELSKYFSIANVFSCGEEVKNEFEIEFGNAEDIQKCINYCLGA